MCGQTCWLDTDLALVYIGRLVVHHVLRLYCGAIKLIKHDPSDNSRFTHLMNKAKWARALQWRPWGLKGAALFGLATFWYDKGSDVKLLSDVWGHTWTSYALLTLLLYQYVLQGYIIIFHIIHAHKFKWFFTLSKAVQGSLSAMAYVLCLHAVPCNWRVDDDRP